MIYPLIEQCTRSLKTLETFLNKAEQHASNRKFDVRILMNSRLAPDQYDLIGQVRSACDYVKSAAAKLSGQAPPEHEDNERSIGELRERIRKTVAFAESVRQEQYVGAGERRISFSWAPGKIMNGTDYLLQMIVPGTFFHVTTAYAILRHNGVDLGKMDYLGSIDLLDV